MNRKRKSPDNAGPSFSRSGVCHLGDDTLIITQARQRARFKGVL